MKLIDFEAGVSLSVMSYDRILSRESVEWFLELSYDLLARLPARVRFLQVELRPRMTSTGGWHVVGVNGRITSYAHSVNFMFHRGKVLISVDPPSGFTNDHGCPYIVGRGTWVRPENVAQFVTQNLNSVVREELEAMSPSDRGFRWSRLQTFLADPMLRQLAAE